MSDTTIIITRPLDLRIELEELDGISFRAEVTFQKSEFGNTVGGGTSVWFGKSEYLTFLRSLRTFYGKSENGSATLSDFSEEFILHVERCRDRFYFSLNFNPQFSSSDLKMSFKYFETIDDDIFGVFRSAFERFPLWQGERGEDF